MKKLLILTAALATSTMVMAYDTARVVRAMPTATAVAPRSGAYQTWNTPPAPVWYGHGRQPAVRYVSTERRGNTWEDDFLDRQMR